MATDADEATEETLFVAGVTRFALRVGTPVLPRLETGSGNVETQRRPQTRAYHWAGVATAAQDEAMANDMVVAERVYGACVSRD
jgi:hypothetical protein